MLRQRELLLVLDNCEHLVQACAALADALLRACPSLRILATSRETLGIWGETAWRVPSLSLPEQVQSPAIEMVLQSEAGRLVDMAEARGRDAGRLFADLLRTSPALEPMTAMRLLMERLLRQS